MDIYPVFKESEQIQNEKASELSGKLCGTVCMYLIKMVELGIATATGKNENRAYILNDKVNGKWIFTTSDCLRGYILTQLDFLIVEYIDDSNPFNHFP